MSKHYEELSGAAGRARSYRPARLNAQQHFSGHAPSLHFDDQSYALADLSAVGFGGFAAGDVVESPEDDSPDGVAVRRGVLRLVQRGKEIFAARARRARLDIGKGKVFAGFALDGGVVDLAYLRRANARAIASAEAADFVDASDVPNSYKIFCADAAHFIGQHLDLIRRTVEPVEAGWSEAEKDAVARDLVAAAAPGWMELVHRGNREVALLQRDKARRAALKGFTERVVLPPLLEGEGFSRTYRKPLGYPGDFLIMNYIYGGEPIGSTVRARFLHLLSLTGAEPVNTRLHKLVQIITDIAAESAPGAPFNLMSVGCGPAREIEHLLMAAPERRWNFLLVDQEPLALECAITRTATQLASKKLSARALHVSFRDMLDPLALADAIGRQRLIYSSGLVDYLSPLMARRLLGRLYQMIEPGGAVVIGNVNNGATGMMWPSEYLVDWTLYFRDEGEMRDMAAELVDAEISVERDALDAILFLVVRKPR